MFSIHVGTIKFFTLLDPVDARSAATLPPKRKPGNGKGASKSKVGRRNLFFKQRGSVVRGTTRVASIISPDVIYYRGQFWQKGDIVSLVDEDDEQVFLAKAFQLQKLNY